MKLGKIFEEFRKESNNYEEAKNKYEKWKLENNIIVLEREEAFNIKKKYKQKQNKEVQRKYRLKREYNLTIEDYNQMLKKQDYKCAICGKEKKLGIDHCHKGKHVRELLCNSCNSMLGFSKDNPSILLKGIEYLLSH